MSIFKNLRVGKSGEITTFEIVTLRESGMRYTVEYEIILKNGQAEISRYGIRYHQHKDERILERRALCDVNSILKVFNDCRILSWDGFNGPHPKGVLDGIMFSFHATVNEGQKISAHGSQNFPRYYKDFTGALHTLLENQKEEHCS